MENSASKESDPIEELKEYLNDEGKDDDPYTLLEDWLDDDDDEPKKKRRKKKTTARFSSVKRDKFGKHSYPYSGKKRYQVKKKLEQDSKTIPRHELSTPDFIFDDQYLPDTAFEDLPEETAKKKKRSWKERMERIEKAWSEEKENIFSSLRLKSAFLSKEKCALCLSKTAAVDCHECRIHLCEICDRDIHNKNPLHNRFSFVNDKTQALTPMQASNDNLEIYTVDRLVPLRHAVCICGSNNFEEIVKQGNVVVITMTGKFDLVPFVLQCCHCNQIVDPFSLKNILISGFWPSSPNNFGCLISEGVFLTWDHFRKHMPGSSSTSFLESLNDLTLHFGRQGRIVHSSFSQAFKQWNFAKYELEMSQGMDWMKCPCCSIKQHACHVDGNCKLYRYKNSGSRRRESYYEESFIAEDKKVDNFISSLQLTKGKALKSFTDTTCGGEWSAARNIERKKKSVDYTGLYVASCRHQYGLKSVNMKRGEIYAYPAYLLTTFILPNNVEYMFADVMCKLWTYLCKVDSDLPSKIKGALSVMHAKGHNLNCQVNWDGEWIQGTGKSTGEECEQLFSYLSRCANTTKYQTPENREETLTEMILFWNRRKTLNLAQNLLKKYNRITNEVSKFTSKLNNKCLEMKIDLKDVDFVSLLNKLKCFARGAAGETTFRNKTRNVESPKSSQNIMSEKWLAEDQTIVLSWIHREMINVRLTKEYINFKQFFPDVQSVDEEIRNFVNSGHKITEIQEAADLKPSIVELLEAMNKDIQVGQLLVKMFREQTHPHSLNTRDSLFLINRCIRKSPRFVSKDSGNSVLCYLFCDIDCNLID